jgi:hypothetical protein
VLPVTDGYLQIPGIEDARGLFRELIKRTEIKGSDEKANYKPVHWFSLSNFYMIRRS